MVKYNNRRVLWERVRLDWERPFGNSQTSFRPPQSGGQGDNPSAVGAGRWNAYQRLLASCRLIMTE